MVIVLFAYLSKGTIVYMRHVFVLNDSPSSNGPHERAGLTVLYLEKGTVRRM